MKKALYALAAVLVCCGVLVLGPVTQAKAECTTQGTLALALAELLKLDATSAYAAVAALTALGVEPTGGWKTEECLTSETTAQIKAAYAATVAAGGHSLYLGPGAIDRTLEALRPIDRQYHELSPSRP
jgi:hypothetical protein